MKIVVTGATGTIGSHVMQALASDAREGAIDVFGATRNEAGERKLEEAGHRSVQLDYDQPGTLRPALEGADAIFLLTGYTVDMLVHSKRILDAAKAEGVRHVVHLGALADDDTTFTHFAWHQMVERATEGMGFSWTHLRPNFFMDTIWSSFVKRPDRIVHFVGDQRVSFVCATDMAEVAARALKNPLVHAGKTYPLAVEALTFSELAAIFTEVTGKPVTYQPRPASDLWPIMQKQGAEPNYARGLCEGVAAIERGAMPAASRTFDTVATVTGRSPIGWREFAQAAMSASQSATST